MKKIISIFTCVSMTGMAVTFCIPAVTTSTSAVLQEELQENRTEVRERYNNVISLLEDEIYFSAKGGRSADIIKLHKIAGK